MGLCSALNLRAALQHVLVVVRPEAAELTRLFSDQGFEVVACLGGAEGRGRSLAAGVAASRHAEGWLVGLADMPFIGPRTIASVAMQVLSGAALAAPYYNGCRGHPVGFGKKLGAELLSLEGDIGAREVLTRHESELVRLESTDRGILTDIDTPADLTCAQVWQQTSVSHCSVSDRK